MYHALCCFRSLPEDPLLQIFFLFFLPGWGHVSAEMSFSLRGLCRSSSKVRYPVILSDTLLFSFVVHISTRGCVNKSVFIYSGPVFLFGLWSPQGQGPCLLCLQLENIALSIQAGTWKVVNKSRMNEWIHHPPTSGLHVKSHSMEWCKRLGLLKLSFNTHLS